MIPPEELVQIDVRGETYTLHYGMHAWVEFQRVSGFSILRDVLTEADLADTERCMQLLWSGLREHHPELTIDDVEKMVTLRDMEHVRERMRDAIRVTSPEVAPGQADPTKAQGKKASRGRSSGRSARKTTA